MKHILIVDDSKTSLAAARSVLYYKVHRAVFETSVFGIGIVVSSENDYRDMSVCFISLYFFHYHKSVYLRHIYVEQDEIACV